MLLVAGLSLKNLQPRVWDPTSPYYLPELRAVMVSYADFVRRPARARAAAEQGIRTLLGVPEGVAIYLDNGAFYFLSRDGENATEAYEAFVQASRPDWWPIPQDFIPTPWMSETEQRTCLTRTMAMNQAYRHDGYVPVVHISHVLSEYVSAVAADPALCSKPALALGGIVPNLLRAQRALPYADILAALRTVRTAFPDKQLHVFGVGGTATLHLLALLGFDSVDSSGWRNRAARGIVQLPGSGDRMVANLGSWRGREPSQAEWDLLAACACPACTRTGLDGLRSSGMAGFANRATHNLWILLCEMREIERRLSDGSYDAWYKAHLDNSIYLPLIDRAVALRTAGEATGTAPQRVLPGIQPRN